VEVISPRVFPDEIVAFMTAKNSSFGGGKIEGLNLGINTADDPSVVIANRNLLSSEIEGIDIVCADQTHGDEIYIATDIDRGRGWLDPSSAIKSCDGFVTNKKHLALTVFLADCVGVLMYDPKNGAIGAVHSGWRGTKKRIANKAVRIMNECYKTKPQDLKIFITPSIRSCCYKINQDVKEQFEEYAFAIDESEGGYRLDLASIIVVDLLKKGVLEKNIELSHMCTCCQKELYSYRREQDKSGRMAALIAMI